MRLREATVAEWIPGRFQQSSRTLREWVCPECDYFEEADEEVSAPRG
jgi:hypothetical protein